MYGSAICMLWAWLCLGDGERLLLGWLCSVMAHELTLLCSSLTLPTLGWSSGIILSLVDP